VKDNAWCTVWTQAPAIPCSRFDKQGDVIRFLNPAGEVRGTFLKIVPGNVEKLAP
jgi:hypothetical protein